MQGLILNKQIPVILIFALLISAVTIASISESANAFSVKDPDFKSEKAPIVKAGENIYIAWWNNKTGNYEVSFTRSTDNGATFQDVINLSNSTNGTSIDARIAAADDNVYVTFTDNVTGVNQIYLAASTDNGATFGEPILINREIPLHSDQASEFGIVQPTDDHSTPVAASGNNVYVVWYCHEIGNNWDVYLRASDDGGKTFGDIVNISNSTDRVSRDPEITADGNNVYVTYWDDLPGDKKVFTRISTDGGKIFGNPIQLKAPTPITTTTAVNTTTASGNSTV